MQKAAVVSYGRKIRALCALLRLPFLLNSVSGNADVVVVLKGQLNGFLQCQVARGLRSLCFLGPGKAGRKRDSYDEDERSISFYHFGSFAEAGICCCVLRSP